MNFDVKIDVNVHLVSKDVQAALAAIPGIAAAIPTILSRSASIMATQQEAAAQLQAHGDKLDKISAETTGLVELVRDLKDQLAASGNVAPELQSAIDRVVSKAEQIDGLVDDVAPNPTETPEDGGTGEGTDTGAPGNNT